MNRSFFLKIGIFLIAFLAVVFALYIFGDWRNALGILLLREGRIEELVFVILIVLLVGMVLTKLLQWLARAEKL